MFFFFWPLRLVGTLLQLIIGLLVTSSCVLTLTSVFLADKSWFWSLASQFRYQYLLIQLLALAWTTIVFFQRARKQSPQPAPSPFFSWLNLTFLMLCIGFNLLIFVPYYLKPAALPTASPSIRLMHANILGKYNRDVAALMLSVQAAQPDILDILEPSPALVSAPEPGARASPLSLSPDHSQTHGYLQPHSPARQPGAFSHPGTTTNTQPSLHCNACNDGSPALDAGFRPSCLTHNAVSLAVATRHV